MTSRKPIHATTHNHRPWGHEQRLLMEWITAQLAKKRRPSPKWVRYALGRRLRAYRQAILEANP